MPQRPTRNAANSDRSGTFTVSSHKRSAQRMTTPCEDVAGCRALAFMDYRTAHQSRGRFGSESKMQSDDKPDGRPQHRAGGMMMLGPPDRILLRGRGRHREHKQFPNLLFLRLPDIPDVCPNSHRPADEKKGRSRHSGTPPAAGAATFRVIGTKRARGGHTRSYARGRRPASSQPKAVLLSPHLMVECEVDRVASKPCQDRIIVPGLAAYLT